MIRARNFAVGDDPCITIMIEGAKDVADFKQLIQNGANLWDQAPPDIKTLADIVTSGRAMQPYEKLTVKNKTPQ